MQAIVTTQYLPEYRMCFFIDGLDEYEGDAIDHLYLARDLQQWSQQPNVKILCSARPHTEFVDTFRQSGKSIQIQDYTKGDIYEHTRQFLENEQKLRSGPIQISGNELKDLAWRIVHLSEGVFLWAILVARSLGTKVGVYRKDQFFRLLEQTPRRLYDLYEGMLMRADKAERQRGDKMLALALQNPYSEPLNAVVYSWMDEIEDVTFPSSMKTQSMSDKEVQARLDLVRRELSDLTAGLLEMRISSQIFMCGTPNPKRANYPFYRYCVEPFHRTVRDFLLEVWFAEKTHAANLKLITPDTYFKLMLAEWKCTASMLYWHTGQNSNTTPSFLQISHSISWVFWLAAQNRHRPDHTSRKGVQVSDETLEGVIPVIQCYQQLLDSNGQGEFSALPTAGHRSVNETHYRQRDFTARYSLIHLACHEEHPDYVMRRVDACKHVAELDTPSKSLLLTAFYESQSTTAYKIIAKGGSLNTKIEVKLYQLSEDQNFIKHPPVTDIVSIWVVAVRLLALRISDLFYPTNYGGWVRPVENMAAILAEALRHGDKVETNIAVLIYFDGQDRSSYTMPAGRCRITATLGSPEHLALLNARKNLHYMSLDQLFDLWEIADEQIPRENGAKDICFLREKLVTSSQNYGLTEVAKLWKKIPAWLANTGNDCLPINLAEEAREKYPQADITQLRERSFTVHGVVSRTEKLVGPFWVALS